MGCELPTAIKRVQRKLECQPGRDRKMVAARLGVIVELPSNPLTG